MKIMRLIGAISVASALTLVMTGAAAADGVAITTTGPDSAQNVTTDNVSSSETDNTNDVKVVSVNLQQANTGDVSANKNTSVIGSGGSGNASNMSDATTSVTIGNSAIEPGQGGSSGSGGQGGSSGAGSGAGGSGGGSTPATGRGGGVLGAYTTGGLGGGAILPVTGPIVPVDVSALRAAWHPVATTPNSLAQRTSVFSAAMLGTAALLSLLGAVGSVVYARRQERRS